MKKLNHKLFKEVIHYFLILEPKMYMAKIHKLLYFLEFDYLERNEQELLGEDFLKNTYGLTANNLAKFLSIMAEEGLILLVKNGKNKPCCSIQEKKYTFKSKIQYELNQVQEKYLPLSTKEIADLSHKDAPYQLTDNKQVIYKQAAFFRDKETSVFS